MAAEELWKEASVRPLVQVLAQHDVAPALVRNSWTSCVWAPSSKVGVRALVPCFMETLKH
eukprot:1159483-Pelagomonas_calceolata.AAC.11